MTTRFPQRAVGDADQTAVGKRAEIACRASVGWATTILAMAGLVSACAPLPQEYTLYNIRPAFGSPYAAFNPAPVPDDGTDPVIASPSPRDWQPAAPAQPAPEPTASASPQSPAPPPDEQASSAPRSPTCGYWRLGCGILWP